MKLVPELLRLQFNSPRTQANKILTFLEKAPTLPFGNVLAKYFREMQYTPQDRHLTVMWYSQAKQIVLVAYEFHIKPKDYLADEEPFNDEPPLYFSESDHYVSPVYRLEQLREEVSTILKEHSMLYNAIWICYVTNSNIINRQDIQDDVWLKDRILCFDNVKSLTPDFCPESSPQMQIGIEDFNYANEHTSRWVDEKDQKTDEDLEHMLQEYMDTDINEYVDETEDEKEKEDIEKDKINNCTGITSEKGRQLFNFNMDDFDLDFEPVPKTLSPKDKPKEQDEFPYIPKMEGLKAQLFLRLEDPEEALSELIGCKQIKKQIKELETLTKYNKMRLDANPNAKAHTISLHAIFQGAPGTGKTTLCKIYGSLLYKAGALSHGHVVLCTRSTFLGENFGSEEGSLQLAINAARGGVLMIDEAYQLLGSEHKNDPGKMVLQLMMNILADESDRDIAVVICGYKEPLERLLSLNEGLASRFTHKFDFPDFTVEELLAITKRRIADYNYHFTRNAWLRYCEFIAQAYKNRDKKKWGNAREVANILDEIYVRHAERCMRLHVTDPDKQNTITVADIKSIHVSTNEKKRNIGFR